MAQSTPGATSLQRTATSREGGEAAISLVSPFGRWARLWVITLAASCFLGTALSNVLGFPELSYTAIYSAEGVFDTLGGMFAGLACLTFGACALRSIRGSMANEETGRPGRWQAYALLAFVALIMTGEEFSWGGRLAGETSTDGWGPDFGLAKWIQPKGARLPMAMAYWAGFFLLLGVFLPRLAYWSPSFGRFMARQRLPLPSLFLSRVWLGVTLISLLLTFNPRDLLSGASDLSEAFEVAMEVMIFAWAWEEYRWVLGAEPNWSSRLWTSLAVAGVLGALFLVMYDLSTRGWPASQSQRVLQRAVEATQRNEVESAIELYRESISLYPLNDAAHYALGVALEGKGRLMEAVPHFEAAVTIVPTSGEYQLALGLAYASLMTGPSLRAAIPHLDQAIRLLPNNDERYATLMQVRGNIEEIRQVGERVAQDPELKSKLQAIQPNRSRRSAEDRRSTEP